MRKIYHIVITGGPCAGKSTTLKLLKDNLSFMGIKVLVCPETATILINAGADPTEYSFQNNVLKMQLHNEIILENIARSCPEDKIVILYDRGTMDNKAYNNSKQWDELLSNLHTSEVNLRDLRYDAVIHQVTTANGALEHYTTENNMARSESPEDAIKLDRLTLEAWVGHPHLRIVDNSTDFKRKVERTLNFILGAIGFPDEIEDERKFFIKSDPSAIYWEILHDSSLLSTNIHIEQTYLVSTNKNEERRIRKRGSNGSYVYYYTIKRPLDGSKRIEKECKISDQEYHRLIREKDSDKQTIIKSRVCFVFKSQYFELDTYVCPCLPFSLLEIEDCPYDNPVFPSIIHTVKEVTNIKEYSNYEIANRKKK